MNRYEGLAQEDQARRREDKEAWSGLAAIAVVCSIAMGLIAVLAYKVGFPWLALVPAVVSVGVALFALVTIVQMRRL
jgi:hypothetical protein